MTVCFKGADFKYETEAILKLFFPLRHFSFFYDGDEIVPDEDGDNIEISVTGTEVSVKISLGNGGYSEDKVTIDPEKSTKNEAEYQSCRMLFLMLRKLTGISPEWGSITGIRPVKKVNALMNEGFSKEDIREKLKEKYFISDRKFELAYLTAATQKHALDTLDKRSCSLYISIPFCPSRCIYCSFVSHSIDTPNAKKLVPLYVDKLCDELRITADIMRETGLSLDTIYIGGGTPSSLSAEQLEKVMKTVKNCFDISDIREYTVEAGRCDTITADKLKVIKAQGATRISVNPQTMNDGVLRAIGRRHDSEGVVKAFRLAREIGFDNINMDTIAGLPTDTPEGFKNTIERLIDLDPEEITVHTLTLKRSANLFREEDMVSDENIEEMVNFSFDRLTSAGYLPYYLYRQKNTLKNLENVGYAKAGKESLYNIYIMEEAQTILACGASGSTKLYDTQTGKISRVFNYKYPYEYISRFDKMCEKKSEITNFFNGGIGHEFCR